MAPKVIIKYHSSKMDKALEELKRGNISINKAAKKYSVPRSTLGDKIRGKYRDGKKIGRDPYLFQEEEKSIVK